MTETDDTTTRRGLLLAGASLATAALAGCVGGRQDPTYTPPTATSGAEPREGAETASGGPERDADATVNMVTAEDGSQVFEPEVVWLEPGGTVTWVNESGAHTATAYAEANGKPQRIPADAEAWDSGMVTEIGGEFSHTFEVQGVYDYYCLPHESLGMIGTVVVGEPDPEGEPGLAPPQSALPEGAATAIERLNGTVSDRLGG